MKKAALVLRIVAIVFLLPALLMSTVDLMRESIRFLCYGYYLLKGGLALRDIIYALLEASNIPLTLLSFASLLLLGIAFGIGSARKACRPLFAVGCLLPALSIICSAAVALLRDIFLVYAYGNLHQPPVLNFVFVGFSVLTLLVYVFLTIDGFTGFRLAIGSAIASGGEILIGVGKGAFYGVSMVSTLREISWIISGASPMELVIGFVLSFCGLENYAAQKVSVEAYIGSLNLVSVLQSWGALICGGCVMLALLLFAVSAFLQRRAQKREAEMRTDGDEGCEADTVETAKEAETVDA